MNMSENNQNAQVQEPTTPTKPIDVLKEKMKTAKTPEEVQKANEEYYRALILEEDKEKMLKAAEKAEEKKMNRLPEKVDMMEAKLDELINIVKTDKKEFDTRLSKMEDVPERKTPNVEEDEIGHPALKAYNDAGGGDWGWRAAEKVIAKMKMEEGAKA